MIYIVNPLIWISIAATCHIFLVSNKRKEIKHSVDVLSIVSILSLIYIILFYLLGTFIGYTHNPYSTTLSGIVINLFSILLVVSIKEYTRYIILNVKIDRYKVTMLVILFIVFLISDINLGNVLNSKNLIDLWAKELIVPIIFNLLMMYLSYVDDYKPAIISRIILILPTIIFSVVPDYEWFIIMSFNIIYSLSTYLIIQYAIGKSRKDIQPRLVNVLNPRKWITTLIITLFMIAFGIGFFPISPVVILTGSMEPSIKPGDLTLIRKCNIDEIKIGDVIEYKLEDYNIVHRVIVIYNYYEETVLITKGDANKSPDVSPVTSQQVIGKLEYTIPYIGYPAYLFQKIVNNNKEVNVEKGK
jgi:signal peptidase